MVNDESSILKSSTSLCKQVDMVAIETMVAPREDPHRITILMGLEEADHMDQLVATAAAMICLGRPQLDVGSAVVAMKGLRAFPSWFATFRQMQPQLISSRPLLA